MKITNNLLLAISSLGVAVFCLMIFFAPILVFAAEQSGSVGLEGKISSPPPTTPASISFPRDGTSTTETITTVTGICPNNTLVKLFKNNVFAGSSQCSNGSFSIKIDLFTGMNELVARVYDDLDQAGPDSAVVRVTVPVNGINIGAKIALTSSFAKKGANPGQKLTWPITLTGGDGPYAMTIDWGDGKQDDLKSIQFAGTINIEHTYQNSGVYNVVIRAVDKNGSVAFLQLVAVANGPVSQSAADAKNSADQKNEKTQEKTKILWQPAAIAIPLIASTFYLGRKYELKVLRKRLEDRDDN